MAKFAFHVTPDALEKPAAKAVPPVENLADDYYELCVRALTPYPKPTVLIPKHEVCRRLGVLGKDGKPSTTIDDWVREGLFTPPLPQDGVKTKQAYWPEAEVQRLIESRIAGMSTRDMKLLVGILEIGRLAYPDEYWETPEGRSALCSILPDAAEFLASRAAGADIYEAASTSPSPPPPPQRKAP